MQFGWKLEYESGRTLQGNWVVHVTCTNCLQFCTTYLLVVFSFTGFICEPCFSGEDWTLNLLKEQILLLLNAIQHAKSLPLQPPSNINLLLLSKLCDIFSTFLNTTFFAMIRKRNCCNNAPYCLFKHSLVMTYLPYTSWTLPTLPENFYRNIMKFNFYSYFISHPSPNSNACINDAIGIAKLETKFLFLIKTFLSFNQILHWRE